MKKQCPLKIWQRTILNLWQVVLVRTSLLQPVQTTCLPAFTQVKIEPFGSDYFLVPYAGKMQTDHISVEYVFDTLMSSVLHHSLGQQRALGSNYYALNVYFCMVLDLQIHHQHHHQMRTTTISCWVALRTTIKMFVAQNMAFGKQITQ